jgi:hypothetical protein
MLNVNRNKPLKRVGEGEVFKVMVGKFRLFQPREQTKQKPCLEIRKNDDTPAFLHLTAPSPSVWPFNVGTLCLCGDGLGLSS